MQRKNQLTFQIDTKAKINSLSSAKMELIFKFYAPKFGMVLAMTRLGLTQNKEALMNDLMLQKLLLIGFALLVSACSSHLISQGRVSYAPNYDSTHGRVEILHSRYDKR